MRRNKTLLSSWIIALSLLTGCFGTKPEANFYEKHENAAKIENEQLQYGGKLETLAKEEQELYQKIITEGKDSNEKVLSSIGEAKSKVVESRDLLSKQKEAMEKAHQSLQKTDKLLSSMKDERQKEVAGRLSSFYEGRYAASQQVNNSYEKALGLEEVMYGLLEDSKTNMKEISNKIGELNNIYREMNKEVDVFNEATEKYNKEKEVFYGLLNP